jgi:small subunit ribosomal protein S1
MATASTENFAELFEQSTAFKQMRAGDILNGTVVKIEKDYVMVGVGLKSDGVIPASQFYNEEGRVGVEVGDLVDVVVELVEDGYGETRLSREKARRAAAWIMLEQASEQGKTVQGVITGKVKGGFTVEIESVRAFLPGSLVDVRPVRDSSYLEGKEIDFKVIKMDHKRNNVVVSRRAVVEEEMSSERLSALENMQEGDVVKGIVKNLTDYGAFIDLGGVDGLLHITDMSWKRIRHPSELINIGDEIDVKVMKYDREKGRVSLGMKQLGNDPWIDLASRYPSGTVITGHVTNLTDYGCFVEVENGIEGLVHMSEMDWTNKNIHPNKVVKVGDEVKAMILEIDESRRRISLGMKQCQDNPWQKFASEHNVGDRIGGTIRSITDFGIFIGLIGEIDGLIHLSDISADKSAEEAVQDYQKGQEIEAVILAIDPQRERISLGIKQINMDPFDLFIESCSGEKGIKVAITELTDDGATLDLGQGITGSLSKDNIEGEIKAGDQVTVFLIDADKDGKSANVTMKSAKKKPARAKKAKRETSSAQEGSGSTTLGDLLKAKMEENQDAKDDA